jgi:hypothetical protein
MKAWLSLGLGRIVVLAVGLAFGLAAPGCSGTKRDFPSSAGAAGALATSGGASGKAGGVGASAGASGGGESAAEAGTAGELDTAGAAGESGTGFACGGLTCAAEAACTNADADAHCVCPTGYTDPRGDGTQCQDIDECTNLNGGCDPLVACVNKPGSYSCGGCPAGYTGTSSTGCVDINECTTNNGGCDKTVTCTNTPGARVCGNCPFGYSGTGESGCVDINECTTNNGGCDKTVTCNNTPGGHTCGDCPAGHSGGGASGCVDINECTTNNAGCDSLVTCTNSPGSFSCGACPTGYTGTGSTGCVDINECATNNGGCSGNATCTNTAGSRTCACKSGYAGDGITCNAPGAGCKWSCTSPGCAQVALDNDDDGHGTSACAAAPGDDCDDTQNSVFPGAAEVCDGIDNDCDKKIDMADGLSLVGAIQHLPSRSSGSIASNGLGAFGLIATSPPSSIGLHWATINSTGATLSGAIFTPEPNSSYGLTRMAWASGIARYGVVYALDGFGGSGSRGGSMAQSGCCWQDFNLPSETGGSKGDVTARGQGDLLYVATSPGNLTLAVRNASAFTLTNNFAVSGTLDTYQPRVAASGTSAGVLWQTVGPRVLNWSLVSPSLVPGATEQLSTAASFVDISAIGAGYGLAWIEGLGFRFQIKRPNGNTQCSSSVVSFGSVPANQQVAVADSAHGAVVVATSPDSNLIRLYRFDSSCKLMDDADVTTTANAPKHPRVALGNGQLLVFWIDASNGHYRLLSDLLCH